MHIEATPHIEHDAADQRAVLDDPYCGTGTEPVLTDMRDALSDNLGYCCVGYRSEPTI
jgi:hypothetical protein